MRRRGRGGLIRTVLMMPALLVPLVPGLAVAASAARTARLSPAPTGRTIWPHSSVVAAVAMQAQPCSGKTCPEARSNCTGFGCASVSFAASGAVSTWLEPPGRAAADVAYDRIVPPGGLGQVPNLPPPRAA